jgi:putative oxidoreductase
MITRAKSMPVNLSMFTKAPGDWTFISTSLSPTPSSPTRNMPSTRSRKAAHASPSDPGSQRLLSVAGRSHLIVPIASTILGRRGRIDMSDTGAWILLLGRILFVLNFVAISGAGFHVAKSEMAVGFSRQMGFPFAGIAGWPTGLWLIVGGLSVALGIYGDIGALMLGAFVIPAAWWFHAFWKVDDPNQKMTAQLLFWRNVTLLGGALIIFVLFAVFGHDLALTITDPLLDLRK